MDLCPGLRDAQSGVLSPASTVCQVACLWPAARGEPMGNHGMRITDDPEVWGSSAIRSKWLWSHMPSPLQCMRPCPCGEGLRSEVTGGAELRTCGHEERLVWDEGPSKG